MTLEQKQELMQRLHAKYQRRLIGNQQEKINGAVELFDFMKSLSDEELKQAIKFENFVLAERPDYSNHLLTLLLTEQFNRLWDNPENRPKLKAMYGIAPTLKRAVKTLQQKLQSRGGDKTNERTDSSS